MRVAVAFVVIAVVALVVVLLLRRRAVAATTAMANTASTAGTPQPQTGLAALLAGTPLSGFANSPAGQAAVNMASAYLPPVALGYQSNIPQQGAKPSGFIKAPLKFTSPIEAATYLGLPQCHDVPEGTPCKGSTLGNMGATFAAAFKVAGG